MKNSFNRFGVSIFLFFATVMSCSKSANDVSVTALKSLETRFFKENLSQSNHLKSIVSFLERKNKIKGFVEKTVGLIGFPQWDKSIILSDGKFRKGASDSSELISVTLIPFVRDSQNFVNSCLQVFTSPTDTSYEYFSDWQYRDTISTGLLGLEQTLVLLSLDKNVFGDRIYKILDSAAYTKHVPRVHYVKINSVDLINKNQNSTSLNKSANYGWVSFTVCRTEWVPINEGQLSGCPPGPDCPQYTDQLVCSDVSYYVYIDDGASGSGGDGGANSGGGGGGSGSGSTPPTCQISIARTSNALPGCDPGWIPVSIGAGGIYNPNLGAAVFNNFMVNSSEQNKIDVWRNNNIDTLGIDSCRRQLLKKLIDVLPSSPLGAFLTKLDKAVGLPTSVDKFYLHFFTRPLLGQNAFTDHASYDPVTNEFHVDITLDSTTALVSTDIFVANVLLHEIIHAYMAYIWRKLNSGASIATISALTQGTVFEAYIDTLKKRDPLNPTMNQWLLESFQHNYMADQVLKYMADIIKLFHNNPNTPDRYYWYLSWAGLTRKSIKTWHYHWPNYPNWPPSNPAPIDDSTRGLKYALTLLRIDTLYNKVLYDEEYSTLNARGRRPVSGGCY
ncbi:MAG: hypothetical protein J0M10_11305 [Chitinophagales bacterium]|nr:hypothetical protein [Chitinophagales bacterium]